MNNEIRKFLSEIGRVGGKKSRRKLSFEQAKSMVKVREAKKAFKKYYLMCFWHMRKDANISKDNINLVVQGLRQYGDRKAYQLADKLCQ